MLFLDSAIFVIFPFSAKVVIYSQIYKIGRPFIEYNRFVSIDENPSLNKYFFSGNWRKIFDFCKR